MIIEDVCKGIVKEISKNYNIIECDSIKYLCFKSDFFYDDIKVNDKVVFKSISDGILKATCISLDKEI